MGGATAVGPSAAAVGGDGLCGLGGGAGARDAPKGRNGREGACEHRARRRHRESKTEAGCASPICWRSAAKTERESKLLASAPRFDELSVYVRWIVCGTYRGTWPPTCIACQRVRRRRHGVGSGLSELVATDSRAPESCAIASRSETSDNFWSGTSTCARANSAKKRAGAVFSGQRRLNRPHTPYLTCRALSSQLPFWPPWPRKAPSGASRRLRPLLLLFFAHAAA